MQDSDIGHIPETVVEGRRSFRIEEFAKKHDLKSLVAGNFYQAEFDDYVPTMHAHFAKNS